MAGICLRGKPGWGDLGASFTTVLNTFGGTWWSAKPDGAVDKAQVDQPAFKQALDFYVSLIKDAGEKDAANASFNECLSQYKDGKVAMWYDATVAAGLLEADDSPVKGKNGYVPAPVDKTDGVGLAVVVGARDPEDDQQAGPRLEVRLVRDRPAVPEGGRARRSPVAGRRFRRAPASRSTRSPSTRRPPRRSPSRRSTRSPPRRSTTRARRSVRACPASSTSGSPSSRTSATSARSSSPR